MTRAGIISGTSETEFSPEKEVTRAEAAALFLRIMAKPEGNDNGGFLDVTPDKWYYYTAGASKRENLIAGYEDNTFRGDLVISKVQLVSLAARVLKAEKPELAELNENTLHYQDVIPEWAKEDVIIAGKMGLAENQGVFNPNKSVTREDAAILLYKLYNLI